MGWVNFDFVGNTTVPEPDDAEIATISETSETAMTLPTNISIVDVVLAGTAVENHQYRFWVNGHAVGSKFFSGQINPATQGRLNWANQNIRIPQGSTLQMRGSQKADATFGGAEPTTVLVQYLP